jgi:hypothetical protein
MPRFMSIRTFARKPIGRIIDSFKGVQREMQKSLWVNLNPLIDLAFQNAKVLPF